MSNTNAILLKILHTNPISVTLKSQKAENYHPEKGGVKIRERWVQLQARINSALGSPAW